MSFAAALARPAPTVRPLVAKPWYVVGSLALVVASGVVVRRVHG